jgi:hypothetical protein
MVAKSPLAGPFRAVVTYNRAEETRFIFGYLLGSRIFL